MTQSNCLTCRHHSHDVERLPVCGLVYNSVSCENCKAIQAFTDYRVYIGGLGCRCGKVMPHLLKDDWREGYIGAGVGGHVTPLPCCPGWESVPALVEPEKKKVLPGQRNLFGD